MKPLAPPESGTEMVRRRLRECGEVAGINVDSDDVSRLYLHEVVAAAGLLGVPAWTLISEE